MHIQHTIRRKGIYYYNRRLPCGSIYRKSLLTDSPRHAQYLVNKVEMELKGMITKDTLDKALLVVLFNARQKIESLADPEDTLELDRLSEVYAEGNAPAWLALENYRSVTLSSIYNLDKTPEEHVNALLADYLDISNNADFAVMYRCCVNLYSQLKHARQLADLGQFSDSLDVIHKQYADLCPKDPTPTPSVPTFKELADPLFVSFTKRGMTQKLITTKRSALHSFLPHLGEIPVDQITFDHLEDAWQPLLDTLSASSLKDKRAFLKDMFSFALRQKHITTSPLDSAELPKNDKEDKRGPFSDKQRQQIITYCKNNPSPESLAVLAMAYAGMRNGEAATTKIVTTESGTPYFNITKGKTSNSARKIPVHQNLISWGILDKWNDNNPSDLTKFYRNTLKPTLNLPDTAADGGKLTLYSLRHNFITALSTLPTAPQSYIKFLVGHRDITSNYTHLADTDLHKMEVLINQLK